MKRLLLIGCCLVAACGKQEGGASSTTAPTPSGSSLTATVADLTFCVDETNRYRAMRSKPALTRSGTLETIAHDAAASDAASGVPHGYFQSHPGQALGENEFNAGINSQSIQAAIAFGLSVFWSEGPGGGHYENMIAGFTNLGCGVATTATKLTIVQDFR